MGLRKTNTEGGISVQLLPRIIAWEERMKPMSNHRLQKVAKSGLALTMFVLLWFTLRPAAVTRKEVPATAAKSDTRDTAQAGISDQDRPSLRASVGRSAQTQALQRYGQLPLRFEANRGQTDTRVKFLARGQGFALFLTGNEAVLDLRPIQKASGRQLANMALRSRSEAAAPPPGRREIARIPNTVLRMKLVGASPNASVTGTNELPGKSNYLIGNNPKKWRTNVPNYTRVEYRS